MKTLSKILFVPGLLLQLLTASCKETQTATNPHLELFASGLTTPVCIANAGDSRLFIIDQHGIIVVLDSGGNKKAEPFLDIRNRVTYGGERGLLGIAFHPRYKDNGYFYVNYVGAGDSTHISRFTASGTNPDKADASSEFNILTIHQPFTNHNGGDLHFGPDGYLYFALGDGGSAGDPGNRAQNLREYLGKIHRIDVNSGNPYGIPASNPFSNSNPARPEIWAYGLRNPWRFSFDRLTGDMWIADVGQNKYEEIDFQPAGTGGINYGWRCFEGNAAYNIDGCNASADYTFPVYVYGHNPECSVTGGYVYRGSKQVSFYGYYFFADYCSDKISMLHKGGDGWIAEDFGTYSGNNFSTFGEDAAGQLYVAGLTSGKIYRISGTTTEEHHPQASVVNVVDMARAGKVRIENNHADGAGMLVNLFDAGGNSLYKATSNKAVFEVDIRTLASGVYLLQVEVNGNALVHRIIKQ